MKLTNRVTAPAGAGHRRASRPAALAAIALLAGSLAGGAVATPALAAPAPAPAEGDGAGACTITGGDFKWGVKESFRSYISGTIANGSWSESDGASYETPNFTWGGATGTFDPQTGVGSASFVGTVHFTGHDGVLDLTLANPTVEFEGDGKAVLLLDARSTDAQGEVAIDAKQEWVGDVDPGSGPAVESGALALEAAPTALTNSGAKAFAGFYQPGVELDAVSLEVTLDGCEGVSPGTEAGESGSAAGGASQGSAAPAEPALETRVPWWPIGIGGAALLVIGLTSGILIAGGRRTPSRATSAGGPEANDVASAEDERAGSVQM